MTTNTYKNKYRLETSPDGFWYTDKLLKFIDNQDDNWAACLNIMDAHHPYEPKKNMIVGVTKKIGVYKIKYHLHLIGNGNIILNKEIYLNWRDYVHYIMVLLDK